jgi:hypothetical protein
MYKEKCPTEPKRNDCVKIKCSKKKPGYSYVTIGNCFGRNIGSIQAEYDGNKGKTCDKYKCAAVLCSGIHTLHGLGLLLGAGQQHHIRKQPGHDGTPCSRLA